MDKVIDFYYEFSSPYGYLAACEIERVAAKHAVNIQWHPFLLGVILKEVGTKPLLDYPMKGEYSRHDLARMARLYDLPFFLPDRFPFMAVNACRLVIWAGQQKILDKSKNAIRGQMSKALYKACYAEQRDIAAYSILLDVAEENGFDRHAAELGMQSHEIKETLNLEVQHAMQKKVFGSPFFIIDGEPFWGFDRLSQVDLWLETGGW